MVEFHKTLSERSVHFRYFGQLNLSQRIAHERLTRICFNDYDREIALVADYKRKDGTHEILGVGRLSKIHGLDEAEFAIVISDQWQGQGLGTRILKLLVEIGRQEKLKRITAHILSDNVEMTQVSREAGFKLAIDDFGVGFASLSQLRRFEVDYLKIDRSFIRELESNPNDQVLCEAIVAMAHKLGIQVIAEGVETADQQALLRAAGCDYAQGYLYAHPQPAAELELLLARTAPASVSA